jgi:hypothetical protein
MDGASLLEQTDQGFNFALLHVLHPCDESVVRRVIDSMKCSAQGKISCPTASNYVGGTNAFR